MAIYSKAELAQQQADARAEGERFADTTLELLELFDRAHQGRYGYERAEAARLKIFKEVASWLLTSNDRDSLKKIIDEAAGIV